jgi:WXG100 family type VII secretion target
MTISVSPGELRGEASFVKTQAADAQASFEALNSRLQNLTSVFTGEAQQRFAEKYQEWHTHAKGLTTSLEGLGQFLATAADVIEEADQGLARGIGGA